MSASSRGSRAAVNLSRRRPGVCMTCRTTQFARNYSEATAASTIAEAHELKPTSTIPDAPITASTKPAYYLRSGIILTRAPIVTRALSPFENAFFFYQKRLNERLVLPFRHTLFFKPDTATDLDYRIKLKERGKVVAKELGRYYPKSRSQWNDELLVGSTLSDESRIRDILIKEAENRVTEDGEVAPPEEIVPVEQPQSRVTEADEKNDVRRLDRALDRTLYFVVKNKAGHWQFPSSGVPDWENLHQAAATILEETAGVNMNTWIVGRVPVAHYVVQPEFNEDSSVKKRGEKIFFLKGRIMAGQADLKGNPMGYTDFNWLTREELKKQLPSGYYYQLRNMMAER